MPSAGRGETVPTEQAPGHPETPNGDLPANRGNTDARPKTANRDKTGNHRSLAGRLDPANRRETADQRTAPAHPDPATGGTTPNQREAAARHRTANQNKATAPPTGSSPSEATTRPDAESQPKAADPSKPPGRRERKKLDTRRRIFRAAVELFTSKGFDATTVEEIAERADVAKGTVFNYFPKKTAFLVASYQEWAVRIREDLGPEESWTDPTRVQLGRMFGHLTDLAGRHRDLARQVIFENMRQAHIRFTRGQRRGPKPYQEQTRKSHGPDRDPEAVRLLEDLTLEVIRRGADRGEVRQGVDPRHAASVIAAAIFQTLIRGLIHGDSTVEIEAGIAARLDLIFSGLAPEAKEQP